MWDIAIFASGSGSNAENLIKFFRGSKSINITSILSENPNAGVLERAKRLNIPSFVFTMDELRRGKVTDMLIARKTHLIVLAGFLKLIPASMIESFPDRIINIHPALLPKYGGKGMYGNNVHKAVVEAGESESGITIHLVNSKYDEGKVLFQAKCPVLPCDKPETLANRIHDLEYEHYPRVIDSYVKQQLL